MHEPKKPRLKIELLIRNIISTIIAALDKDVDFPLNSSTILLVSRFGLMGWF